MCIFLRFYLYRVSLFVLWFLFALSLYFLLFVLSLVVSTSASDCLEIRNTHLRNDLLCVERDVQYPVTHSLTRCKNGDN